MTSYTISIFSKAYADEVKFINQGMLQEPKVSSSSRFFRGLLGTKMEGSKEEKWFVIVGSHENYGAAKKQVSDLAKKSYQAKVYRPFQSSKHYAVVIASNVTIEEAKQIQTKAIADGLPSESYLWSF